MPHTIARAVTAAIHAPAPHSVSHYLLKYAHPVRYAAIEARNEATEMRNALSSTVFVLAMHKLWGSKYRVFGHARIEATRAADNYTNNLNL